MDSDCWAFCSGVDAAMENLPHIMVEYLEEEEVAMNYCGGSRKSSSHWLLSGRPCPRFVHVSGEAPSTKKN